MRFVYIVIAYLLAPVVLGTMALRGFRDRSHWEGFSQRLGLGARSADAASGCMPCRWGKCRQRRRW
jgi:hypothetical protein